MLSFAVRFWIMMLNTSREWENVKNAEWNVGAVRHGLQALFPTGAAMMMTRN